MKRESNFIRKLLKVTLTFFSVLLFLLLTIFFVLKSSRVQTYVTQRLSSYLSDEYNTVVKTGRVELSLFEGLVLEDLYVEDQQKDTLLYVGSVGVFPKGFPRSTSKLNFRSISADRLYLNVYELPDSTLNMQFILDAFASEDTSETSELLLTCRELTISESRINYRVLNPDTVQGINYGDLALRDFNFDLEDFKLHNDDIDLASAVISMKEKSGFNLDGLSFENASLQGNIIQSDAIGLSTPQSFIEIRSFIMDYSEPEAFSNFSDAVYLNGIFSDSTFVTASDLNAFLDEAIMGFDDLALSGTLSGKVNQMQLRNFKLRVGNILRFQLQANINNLLNFDSLAFDTDIENFRADPTQFSNLRMGQSDSALIEVPEQIRNLQQIDFDGSAVGDLNNYRAAGNFQSPMGNLSLRVTGGRDSLRSQFIFGQVVAEDIQVRKILENDDFGQLSMKQEIDFSMGRDEKITFETSGLIDSADYKNYRYRAVNLYARMQESNIDSFLIAAKDENLDLVIFGSANFNHQLPAFKVQADINHADVHALNLYTNQYPARLSFNVSADFIGDSPDNFIGQISLSEPFRIELDTVQAELQNFYVSSEIAAYEQGNEVKRYRLSSDILDGEMKLKGSTSNLLPAVLKTLSGYLPALIDQSPDEKPEQLSSAEMNFDIKDAGFLFQFIDPGMALAEGTHIESNFDSRTNYMDAKLTSPGFRSGDILIKDFYFNTETRDDFLSLSLGTAEADIGLETTLKNLELNSKMYKDTADLNLLWNNKADTMNTKADIRGKIAFDDLNNDSSFRVKATLQKSNLMFDGQTWTLSDAEVMTDSSYIKINDLAFVSNRQKIAVNGEISHKPDSELKLQFVQFELKTLQNLLPEGFEADGTMNGEFRFRELYSDFIVLSKDTIENMRVNNISLGDMYLRSDWNSSTSGVNFSFYNKYGDVDLGQKVQVTDSIYGTYWPVNDSIAVAGSFEGFNLRTFRPLYEDYIDFMRGSQLTGDFKVDGFIKNPQLRGSLALKITGLGINYLQTAYSVNESLNLSFNNQLIQIDTTKLYSRGGGEAFLFGDIKHNSFNDFDFDITLQTKEFQFLNTPPADTSYFYGTAYGSGLIYVKGTQDELMLDIDIATDKNTAFYIPLSSSETLEEEQSFMTFETEEITEEVQTDIFEEPQAEMQDTESGNMSINMNLAVTPGAEIQLIMDEQTGDIIKARGSGDLQISINSAGDFQMLGDYTIEKGDYLFTLQNFFSKHFTIRKGGTIHWTGNPEEADIDLTAVYALPKVGIYSLLLDPSLQAAKTPVNCIIDMDGDLNNPAVKFDVEFPNDEYRVAQHFKVLAQDEVNEQFLSLLLIGSFQPLPGLSQEAATGSPVKIGELVSNQLNRRLSDLTKDVDVGVNYQTGSDITTDELALELSTRLWDDRITIGGNVGVGGGLREAENNSQTDNIIGEVEVNVKLNPKGTIQLRAYNKANDDFTYDQGLYTQGVGFFWRREFDKILFLNAKNAADSAQDSNNNNDSIPESLNDSGLKPKQNDEEQ
jgi:hypothetical protein